MRISATLVDQWLRYIKDETGYATESDLIKSIKGIFEPNRKMLCGMAFDQILQEPEKYRKGDSYTFVGRDCPEGITFPAQELDEQCSPLFQEPGLWQPKETSTVEIDGETVTVVTKADRLSGNLVDEIKTYWSTFDYDKYADAHQWRWYALNFGVPAVRYSCFGWTENSKGELRLNDVHRFTLYAYSGMREECVATLSDLVDYINRKGLSSYVADDRPRTERQVA